MAVVGIEVEAMRAFALSVSTITLHCLIVDMAPLSAQEVSKPVARHIAGNSRSGAAPSIAVVIKPPSGQVRTGDPITVDWNLA